MPESLLDLLGRLLDRLDAYARTVDRAALESDLDTWLKVSRAMELAAQCCIDLAATILAMRGLGAATSYRQAFLLLAQGGVIPPALATRLEAWAGLRNVLAHVYTELDLERLVDALRNHRDALREFGRIAAAELSAQEADV